MTSIETRAAETVARIMAEGNEQPEAFEAYEISPYEFDWGWAGQIGNSDYIYRKRELGKVQGRAKSESKGSRSGGGARAARATSLSQMSIDCPTCNIRHSVLQACI
jgi:hypothetical protein